MFRRKKGIVLFLKPSSVEYPPEKGSEKGTMTPIEVYRPVSKAFFGGISTGEGLGKGYYDSYRGI